MRKAKVAPQSIEPKLKKLEAIAGTKNFPLLFNIPMTTAAKETKMRKGNIIIVNFSVSATFPGTAENSSSTRMLF